MRKYALRSIGNGGLANCTQIVGARGAEERRHGLLGFQSFKSALAVVTTLLSYMQHHTIVLETVDQAGHQCLFFFCALTTFGLQLSPCLRA